MLLHTLARHFGALTLLLMSCNLLATQITVVDQQGVPVSGAVIGIGKLSPKANSTPLAPSIMDQVDFQFVPKILVIDKQQWVSFPNSDNVRHHIYSFSSPKSFEIKMFSGTNSPPIQFSEPGIVVLGCNIHDSMVGYIYVADSALTLISDENGQIALPTQIAQTSEAELLTNGQLSASLWHPLLSADNIKRISINIDLSQSRQTIELPISQQAPQKTAIQNGFMTKFKGAH